MDVNKRPDGNSALTLATHNHEASQVGLLVIAVDKDGYFDLGNGIKVLASGMDLGPWKDQIKFVKK